ncbi:hypothetical protein KXD40_005839 [Peronospora effusa]|nr:hypothetical protein KXD40_005839 [Peronospora effusa]
MNQTPRSMRQSHAGLEMDEIEVLLGNYDDIELLEMLEVVKKIEGTEKLVTTLQKQMKEWLDDEVLPSPILRCPSVIIVMSMWWSRFHKIADVIPTLHWRPGLPTNGGGTPIPCIKPSSPCVSVG